MDAILVCTPTTTHAHLIERGARAGKAVFCEKPVDLSSARIETCLATVEKAGTPLMIGFNRRFDPNFASLRRRLADGEVGELEPKRQCRQEAGAAAAEDDHVAHGVHAANVPRPARPAALPSWIRPSARRATWTRLP